MCWQCVSSQPKKNMSSPTAAGSEKSGKKQSARAVVSGEIHATEERLNKRLDGIVAILEAFVKLNKAKFDDLQAAVEDVSGQVEALHEEFSEFVDAGNEDDDEVIEEGEEEEGEADEGGDEDDADEGPSGEAQKE